MIFAEDEPSIFAFCSSITSVRIEQHVAMHLLFHAEEKPTILSQRRDVDCEALGWTFCETLMGNACKKVAMVLGHK